MLVHSLFNPNGKIIETTFAPVVRGLRRNGVRRIIATVAYAAFFAPGALRRIRGAGARKVAACSTVPHPANEIKTAPIVAAALAGEKW